MGGTRPAPLPVQDAANSKLNPATCLSPESETGGDVETTCVEQIARCSAIISERLPSFLLHKLKYSDVGLWIPCVVNKNINEHFQF